LHDPESAEASFTIRSGLASIGQNEKRFARLKMRITAATELIALPPTFIVAMTYR
jgi:hypothetical protein